MIINSTTFDLLLRKHGITQAALAKRARLGTKTIGRIRRGEELRLSNAEKIAAVFGVSIEALQLPPSEQLEKDAGKKSGLSRLVADLRGQALNALTLTSLRYKIPEQTILEAGPYMFTILAELSLKRRRDKLEAWKDAALAAVEPGPRREWPTIEAITTEIWDLYHEELESIEKRDLSGGYEGIYVTDETAEEENALDSHHPFFCMLAEIGKESGYEESWIGMSSSDMAPSSFQPHSQTNWELFDPEHEIRGRGDNEVFREAVGIVFDVLDGEVLLRDMPNQLLAEGTGSERRAWAKSQKAHHLRSHMETRANYFGDTIDGAPDA